MMMMMMMMMVMGILADLEPRHCEYHDGKAECKFECAVAKGVAESADHDVRQANAGPEIKWRLSGRRVSYLSSVLHNCKRRVGILAKIM
jgi:hypothetical protein